MICLNLDNMTINALGSCHPDCTFCARDFFKWLKTRMTQMAIIEKGQVISFAEAAATSIIPKNDGLRGSSGHD
jgi:hypothetical protein